MGHRHALTAPAVAPKVTVVDQLAQLQIEPEQVRFIGTSHYHADHADHAGHAGHAGQAAMFPR